LERGIKRVLDYADYLATPEDGQRYEIIEGELHVTPAPRPIHQRVSRRIESMLGEYFHARSLGEVFYAPIDLILTRHDVLQPDVLVVDDRGLITERGIEGPPLLVVEILSRGTAERDRGVKARRYAELGIRHYWLVDPAARCVECFGLTTGGFERLIEADGDATLEHPDFPGLALPLSTLWADSEAPVRD
jgi:Uma2 family endonuclease